MLISVIRVFFFVHFVQEDNHRQIYPIKRFINKYTNRSRQGPSLHSSPLLLRFLYDFQKIDITQNSLCSGVLSTQDFLKYD